MYKSTEVVMYESPEISHYPSSLVIPWWHYLYVCNFGIELK